MSRIQFKIMLGLVVAIFFCRTVKCATPIILNYSLSAGTGDIIYLQGSDFGISPVIEYSYNDSNWKPMTSVTSGKGVVTATIPGSETRLPDILTIRISSDGVSWSAPVVLNKPLAFGFDSDVITPNAHLRIFGRNLLFNRMPTVRLVDSSTGSSQFASVNVTQSTHYALSVLLPPTIVPTHTYQAYVSNGYSGNSQATVESAAGELLVGRAAGIDYWQISTPWAGDFNFSSNVYNIKSDSRLKGIVAKGDGVSDDTWPIMNAIQTAAAAGGGVVLLPSGSYTIHFPNGCGIQLLPRVVLAGTGANQVTVNYGYPMGSSGGYAVCFANYTGLVDLTLKNVDTAQAWQLSGLSSGNSEVFIKRVTWDMGTSQWLNFLNDDHIVIEDSTISQGNDSTFNSLGPLLLQKCAHCRISGNSINFVVGGQNFDYSSDLIFENNVVSRDISSPPDPSTTTHSIAANFVTNFVVLSNTFTSIGNTAPTNNDGEVIETEGGGPVRSDEFRGTVSTATSTTLTDGSQNFLQSQNSVPSIRPGLASVAIISGNALGQTRRVTGVSADGHTISVDHPWDVQPDQTSNYATFDWSAQNWLVVNNRLLNNYKGFEIFNASATNILYESNSMIDSDGVMISPSENAPGLFNFILNIDIVGNSISDAAGLRPAFIAVVPREDLQPASMGTHIIGSNVTSNNVVGFTPNVRVTNPGWDDYKVVTEGYLCEYYWQSYGGYDPTAPAPLLGAVFQDNTSTNASSVFYLNSGASQTALVRTLATNSGPVEDVALAGANRGSEGTVVMGSLSSFPIAGLPSSSAANVFSAVASSYGTRAIGLTHPMTSATANQSILLGQEVAGDSAVQARATLASGAMSTGMVVMNAGSSSDGAFAGVGLTEGNIVITTKEFQQAATSLTIPFPGTTAWLQLKRASGKIVAMYSSDGSTWTQKPISIQFPSRVYNSGIAAVSNAIQPGMDIIFDGFTITGALANTQPVATGGAPSQRNNPFATAVKSIQGVAVAIWRHVKSFFVRVL